MNTTLTPADLDPRRQAMLLYFQGYRVARIAEMLGEKVATVHSWEKRDKWGDYGPLIRCSSPPPHATASSL